MLVFPFSVFAFTDDSLHEIYSDEKQEILKRINAFQKSIHSIRSTVDQEKQLSVMKEKIRVEGTVIMAKPNMLRWETVKPQKSITVIDGSTMTVFYPDEKEAQVYPLSENFMARNTMNFFTTALGGDVSEMEKRFAVNMYRKDSEIFFKLTPLSKIVGRYLSSLIICYDEPTGLPKGFEVTTTKGDRTVTTLADIKSNYETDPEVFRIKLPDDVRITNQVESDNK